MANPSNILHETYQQDAGLFFGIALGITRSRADAEDAIHEASTDPDYPADTLDFLLSHLDDTDREILLLKLVQGFSFREIAELTDRSANTIATRYRRSLEQLRAVTQKEIIL